MGGGGRVTALKSNSFGDGRKRSGKRGQWGRDIDIGWNEQEKPVCIGGERERRAEENSSGVDD